MLISAVIIVRPRRRRRCAACGKAIDGPALRLYGSAEREPPSVLHLHPACTEWRHPKVLAAKADIEA